LAAVERLGEIGKPSDAAIILDRIPSVDERDAILKQAHWIATRDLLGRAAKASERFPQEELLPPNLSATQYEQRARDILKVLQAVRQPSASSWSLELIVKASTKLAQGPATPWLKEALLNVATTVDESQIPRVLTLVDLMVADKNSKAEQILLIAESQKQRNGKLSPMLVDLGRESLANAAQQWLAQATEQNTKLYGWTALAARGREHRPWPIEPRSLNAASYPAPAEVSKDKIPFWSSMGLSERYTGTWTSSSFEAKEKLAYWVAGHDGLPNEADRKENFVRIALANPQSGDWVEIHRTYAPRNDVAKYVSVDLSEHAGRQVRIEVVDGCGLDSYAWIAIADVSEPGLMRSSLRDQYDSLLRMAKVFGGSVIGQDSARKTDFLANWTKLVQSDRLDGYCKANLQQWVQGQDQPVLSDLVSLIVERGLDDLLTKPSTNKEGKPWRFDWDWSSGANEMLSGLAEAFGKRANAATQEELVSRWSRHRTSSELMESLIRRGALSKDSLRILPASWWESLPAQTAERFADLKPEGPSDTDRALVVQAKADAVRKAAIDLDVGKRVFQERCASCHQLGGQGKVIGPQLDGAIVRTIDRLCEDILWPNRNVDEAFRITNVLLEDGETFSGLILDRNDSSLEIVDQAGKSQRVARGQIEQEKISKLSLMPGNFEELISDAELASLIGFMKSQQPANKP
ncbi:MAG: c-type cytochrome, partial [Planctomycetota bacterium]